MLDASWASHADTDWATMDSMSRILPRKGASAPQLPPVPLDRLVRIGRIVRIVLEPPRMRYGGLLAFLNGLLLVRIGVLDRVTGPVLARRDDGFTHGAYS